MRQMAKETHIKTDKNPLLDGVLGSYFKSNIFVERDNPKIVGDGIGKRAPLMGQGFAKEP